jgi:hypothetical protein
MDDYRGKRFTREQLIFISELVFTAAGDRIEACLPMYGAHKSDLKDYQTAESARANMICGQSSIVAAFLPILYAKLQNDGMGIGEFPQFEKFEKRVETFIAEKTNPKSRDVKCFPSCHDLAVEFVDEFFPLSPITFEPEWRWQQAF